MTAYLSASLAISTLELLAGRVVPVPFDGSTVVEGRFVPPQHHPQMLRSVASLPLDLEKAKIHIKNCNLKMKSTQLQIN